MGQGCLRGFTSQLTSPVQLSRSRKEHGRSDVVVPDEPRFVKNAQCLIITSIRVTHISSKLRRIPVGCYVVFKSENGTQQTLIKPALVGKDVIEWDDKISLPSEHSSKLSLTVLASFELGPTLGSGEVVRELDATVGELLDRSGESDTIKFSEQGDGSVEIKIQTIGDQSGYPACVDPAVPETCRIQELTDMGHGALIRYRELQKQRDLDKSIRYFEQARDMCPVGHPSHATVLFNLANAKMMRCYVSWADLDVPINLYKTTLSLRSGDHPDYPFALLSLGIAVKTRFQRQNTEGDEAEGDALLSQVLNISQSDSYVYHAAVLALNTTAPPELLRSMETPRATKDVNRLDATLRWFFAPDASTPMWLDPLGILFCLRLGLVGRLISHEREISALEVVAQYTSYDHPHKPLWLSQLADSLWNRYERNGNVADMEKSISLREDAVRITPDGHPKKPTRLGNLAILFLNRYERFADVSDLERSISLKMDALRLTPDDHPEKSLQLCNLAVSLADRYERFGDIADLEKSLSIRDDVVQLTPDGHPEKPTRLADLAQSLSSRFKRFGDITDLEKCISLEEDVVELTPDGHPDKPTRLANLAESLSHRYKHLGDVVDLDKSIALEEDAVRLISDDHSEKRSILGNFARSLWERYERFGDVRDLEKSISLDENTVQLIPDDHPAKPRQLHNIASSLLGRYLRFGEIADLERSILLKGDMLRLTPDDHPDKPRRLHNLAASLSIRYGSSGDIADLEKSISMREVVVQLTPDGHPEKPALLNSLACSLLDRYKRFGDVMDLERSIILEEVAMESRPDGHPDRPKGLCNLARSLSRRYERFRNAADLEKSISLEEHAMQSTPDGHPDKPLRLHNLACSLWSRYELSGDIADLEKSLSLGENAVLLTPGGHTDMTPRLHSLSHSLLGHYRRFRDVADLEKSISFGEDAVQLTPDGHPDKALFLKSTADSFLQRFRHPGHSSISDLRRAISYSSRAAHFYTGRPFVRFQSSQLWIECLRLLSQETQYLFDGYDIAINLLPQLSWIGLSYQDRYHQLLQAAGVVSDAAAVALDLHKPELAIEWLEQGRSIMWNQLSQLRTPVDDLRSVHTALATQFEQVSHELEHAGVRDGHAFHALLDHSNVTNEMLGKQSNRHHELARQRDTLLTEIRALPGFERFLLPKTIDQLSSLAYSGHVVLLNASKQRCDALIIPETSRKVIHVSLSHTSYAEITDMRRQFSGLLRHHGRVVLRDEIDHREGGARPICWGPDDVFQSILPRLWNNVVRPILDALGVSVCVPRLIAAHQPGPTTTPRNGAPNRP